MGTSSLPQTWPALIDRFARHLGGPSFAPDVREWLQQAVEGAWGAASLHALPRPQRVVAFQKAAGVLLALDDLPVWDLGFQTDQRQIIQGVVRRYFGCEVDGPPWRVAPTETDRPTEDAWRASADFNEGGA